jgi:hypothetical protein
MIKKIFVTAALVALIGVLVFGAINRTQAKSGSEIENTGQGGYGRGGGQQADSLVESSDLFARGQGGRGNGSGQNPTADASGEHATLLPAAPGELSAEEAAALAYMREEEKLAHDVYVTLFEQWSLETFQTISLSEQSHFDAVGTLLERYGLDDPASANVGAFANPDLQALYADLVKRGSQSLAEALKVGATIEEIDILDLRVRLAQTDNADIQQVYNNLLDGSYNHLRAFVTSLSAQTGETYQPQYLSEADYQAIIAAQTRGGGNGNGRGGGQGGYRGGRP